MHTVTVPVQAELDSRVNPQVPSPKVSDLMTPNPITLTPEDSLLTLVELMKWKSVRHVPVTGPDQNLVGLITQRDFLTVAVSRLAQVPPQELQDIYSHLRIGDLMGRKVLTIAPDAPAQEAAEVMFRNKFGCLPVIDEGKVIGIITEADFVRAFITLSPRWGQA